MSAKTHFKLVIAVMEGLLIFAGILAGIWVLGKIFGTKDTPAAPPPHVSREGNRSPSSRQMPAGPENVYRPRASNRTQARIVFDTGSQAPGAEGLPTAKSLEGLHDAFTGAPLNIALGLHQCRSCRVYYHSDSVAVLRAENGFRCVACGNASISALSGAQARSSRGRDHNPDVVTLANFRSHFDRVVTFEGRVHAIRVSRRGSDFAVMFEQASWTRGLKLVFFRGAVREVGGASFIHSLSGKSVRVRGLLINHHQFGPEIIISERSMILSVSI